MRLRVFAALFVYVASYLPLSVILLVQDIPDTVLAQPLCLHPGTVTCAWPTTHPGLAFGAVVFCFTCFAITLLSLAVARPKRKIALTDADYTPADLMNYTLPYIVSLIGIDYGSKDKLLGFIVFFAWMFLITYRSGLIVLNPVLTVFGWRLYYVTYTFEAGDGTQHQGQALSRVALEVGRAYAHSSIQNVLIVKSS